MTRILISILFLAAVILIGSVPHAVMAEGSPDAAGLCHQERGEMHEQGNPLHHRGSSDQMVSGVCVIACVGPIADWPQPLSASPIMFSSVIRWTLTAPILRDRQIDPDDRPPKSI
jgi:hypothetical protein